jgi:branched-chain amino acid transport system ATP-binding protein
MLKITHVTTHYGPIKALDDVSIEVGEKEIVCLLGGNASGKSTTMKTILGIVKPTSGTVEFMGERIDGLPTHAVVRKGISPVPESRRIFGRLSVRENLEMGAFMHRNEASYKVEAEMEEVFALFPRLKERLDQDGITLSGGEQQMLAIGRALMAQPNLLLLDEPLLGLSPLMEELLAKAIMSINKETGITTVISEQYARPILPIINYGYVLENGGAVLEGTSQELIDNPDVKSAYFGL